MSDDSWADFESIRSSSGSSTVAVSSSATTVDDSFFEVAPVASTPQPAPGGDDFWAADFVSAPVASESTQPATGEPKEPPKDDSSDWAAFSSAPTQSTASEAAEVVSTNTNGPSSTKIEFGDFGVSSQETPIAESDSVPAEASLVAPASPMIDIAALSTSIESSQTSQSNPVKALDDLDVFFTSSPTTSATSTNNTSSSTESSLADLGFSFPASTEPSGAETSTSTTSSASSDLFNPSFGEPAATPTQETVSQSNLDPVGDLALSSLTFSNPTTETSSASATEVDEPTSPEPAVAASSSSVSESHNDATVAFALPNHQVDSPTVSATIDAFGDFSSTASRPQEPALPEEDTPAISKTEVITETTKQIDDTEADLAYSSSDISAKHTEHEPTSASGSTETQEPASSQTSSLEFLGFPSDPKPEMLPVVESTTTQADSFVVFAAPQPEPAAAVEAPKSDSFADFSSVTESSTSNTLDIAFPSEPAQQPTAAEVSFPSFVESETPLSEKPVTASSISESAPSSEPSNDQGPDSSSTEGLPTPSETATTDPLPAIAEAAPQIQTTDHSQTIHTGASTEAETADPVPPTPTIENSLMDTPKNSLDFSFGSENAAPAAVVAAVDFADFGNFDTAAPATSPPSDDFADFSDFNSAGAADSKAEDVPDAVSPAESGLSKTDDFGNFDATVPAAAPASDDLADFSGLSSAGAANPKPEDAPDAANPLDSSRPTTISEDISLGFSNSSSAQHSGVEDTEVGPATVPIVDSSTSSSAIPDAVDDFPMDFNSTTSVPSGTLEPVESPASSTVATTSNEEDFGGFADFNNEPAKISSQVVDNTTNEIGSQATSASETKASEPDFGFQEPSPNSDAVIDDFGEFPDHKADTAATPAPSQTVSDDVAADFSAPAPVGAVPATDDFGSEFATAEPSSSAPASSGDDFGDFADFQAAPATTGDDFGDFGDFSTSNASAADDDFADFETAPQPAAPAVTPTPNPAQAAPATPEAAMFAFLINPQTPFADIQAYIENEMQDLKEQSARAEAALAQYLAGYEEFKEKQKQQLEEVSKIELLNDKSPLPFTWEGSEFEKMFYEAIGKPIPDPAAQLKSLGGLDIFTQKRPKKMGMKRASSQTFKFAPDVEGMMAKTTNSNTPPGSNKSTPPTPSKGAAASPSMKRASPAPEPLMEDLAGISSTTDTRSRNPDDLGAMFGFAGTVGVKPPPTMSTTPLSALAATPAATATTPVVAAAVIMEDDFLVLGDAKPSVSQPAPSSPFSPQKSQSHHHHHGDKYDIIAKDVLGRTPDLSFLHCKVLMPASISKDWSLTPKEKLNKAEKLAQAHIAASSKK